MTALTQNNEPFWEEQLSGRQADAAVEINRFHYLYNCTNVLDVIFRGAKPVYQEIGPFEYSEENSYRDIVYNQSVSDPVDGNHRQAITGTYT